MTATSMITRSMAQHKFMVALLQNSLLYMLAYYGKLYRKTESWFTIKYSSQCLFALIFVPVIYYGMPEYVGTTPEESSLVNVLLDFLDTKIIDTKRTARTCCNMCSFHWI